jgi:hypothetical protein
MIIIVRVIPNTVKKSLILHGFDIFHLDENMLNIMIIDFFLVSISKKGTKINFWMFNVLKNNFPGTL